MNRTAGEVGIHANMLGQLMLDRISSYLKCPSTVTMESRSRNENTKVLQHPVKSNRLLNSRRKCTNLGLNAGADDSGLLLGPPHNQRRAEKQAVAGNGVTIVRRARPGGIKVCL